MRFSSMMFVPLGLLVPSQIAAQSLSENEEKQAEELSEDAQRIVGGGGPVDRAASGISGSAFQVNLSEGEAELGIALNFDLWDSRVVADKASDEKGSVFRITDQDLVLKATAPIEKGETLGQFFKKDSIVSGSTLTLSYTSTSTRVKTGTQNEQATKTIQIACTRKFTRDWGQKNPEKQAFVGSYIRKSEEVSENQPLRSYIVKLREITMAYEGKELADGVRTNCLDKDVYTILAGLNDADRERLTESYERVTFVDKPARFWGVEASYGQDDYDVLDRTAFEVTSVQRDSWEIGGYLGLIGPDTNWSFRAKAAYGRRPELAEEGEECRMIVGVMEPECIKGPDGLPKRIDTGLFSLEGRQLIGEKGKQQIAIAPLISYDVEEDDVRFELPIYLAPNDDGKLSGGIKLGYSSDEDEVGIGIFVTTPFSVFFD